MLRTFSFPLIQRENGWGVGEFKPGRVGHSALRKQGFQNSKCMKWII